MAITFLCTRVLKPYENVWEKLRQVVHYLSGMVDDTLTTVGENIGFMQSFVDASYAVNNNMSSHMGGAEVIGTSNFY